MPPTDPLRVFLSGKRQHERIAVSISVELGGLRDQFGAQVVDISLGGALLALSQTSLDRVRQPDEDAFRVVAREFAEGFDVSFLDAGVVVEAVPVRLCIPPGEEDRVYLGCRFAEALSDRLRKKLGLPHLGAD